MMQRGLIFMSLALGLILGLSGCAQTGSSQQEEAFEPEVVSVPEYREFLRDLRYSLAEGEPRELTPPEQRRYERIDRRMSDLLSGHDSVDTLNKEQKTKLFNLHEDLQALISGRDEDQVICRRERTVGTHFQTEQCRTRAEWRQARERSMDFMQDRFRVLAIPPGGAQ